MSREPSLNSKPGLRGARSISDRIGGQRIPDAKHGLSAYSSTTRCGCASLVTKELLFILHRPLRAWLLPGISVRNIYFSLALLFAYYFRVNTYELMQLHGRRPSQVDMCPFNCGVNYEIVQNEHLGMYLET